MDTTDPGTRDRQDLERLTAGQDAGLNDLMERHGLRVFHFLYRMLGNEEDANDLAQETFVRVYQNSSTFTRGRDFSKWLYTIAANLARNQLRWRSRHPNVSIDAKSNEDQSSLAECLPSPNLNPDQQLTSAERHEAVQAAVQALPEGLRASLVLCEWEEFSVKEAATILETTPKAVESRLYRARQQLREELKQWL